MTRKLLTGNGAAAWGARLANTDYIPAFPITPQTEIIEDLSIWIDNGDMDARMVTLESEHSMITAAGSAATSGVRVFTALRPQPRSTPSKNWPRLAEQTNSGLSARTV